MNKTIREKKINPWRWFIIGAAIGIVFSFIAWLLLLTAPKNETGFLLCVPWMAAVFPYYFIKNLIGISCEGYGFDPWNNVVSQLIVMFIDAISLGILSYIVARFVMNLKSKYANLK